MYDEYYKYYGVALQTGNIMWEQSGTITGFRVSGTLWVAESVLSTGDTLYLRGTVPELFRSYLTGSILDSPGWFMFLPADMDIGQALLGYPAPSIPERRLSYKDFLSDWVKAVPAKPFGVNTAQYLGMCFCYNTHTVYSESMPWH